jgi:ribosome-associated toxin RatA of RatAB toxin-antitoxin module
VPDVTLELVIKAPVDRVWRAVTDIERYPATMANVRAVKILEVISPQRRRCSWSVTLKGSILQWEEVEELDDEEYIVGFQQISGDMAVFEGSWRLEEIERNTTIVRFTVAFEIGIPLLAEMLNPVAQRSLRDNCLEMLRGVEKDAIAA